MDTNSEQIKRKCMPARPKEEEEEEADVKLSTKDDKVKTDLILRDASDNQSLEYRYKGNAVEYWTNQWNHIKGLNSKQQSEEKSLEDLLKEWEKVVIPYFTDNLLQIKNILIKLLNHSKQSHCNASATAGDEHGSLVQQIKQINSLETEVLEVDLADVDAVQTIMDKIREQTQNAKNWNQLEEGMKCMEEVLENFRQQNKDPSSDDLLKLLLCNISKYLEIAKLDLEIAKKDAKLDLEIAKKDLEMILSRGIPTTLFGALGVYSMLDKLACLSQAEGSCSIGTKTYSEYKRSQQKISVEDMEDELRLPGKYQGPVDQEWLENIKSLWVYEGKESPQALFDLNSAYQEFVHNATFLKRIGAKSNESLSTKEYEDRMEKAVAILGQKYFNQDEGNQNNSDEQSSSGLSEPLAKIVPGRQEGNHLDGHFFPGPTSQEVEGAQDIFDVLLGKLAKLVAKDVINEDNDGPDSPCRQKRRKTNAIDEVIGSKKKSIGDFSIWHHGHRIWVLRDDAMELVFQIKPGQRVDSSVDTIPSL